MTHSNSTRTQPLLQLSDYTLFEQIYRGTRTIVYRAMQTETQRPVVIKVLHHDYPSFSELVQFRNQYTVTKNLPIPGIVQPLSLEFLGNSYALVMEDLGSIALGQYLQKQPLSLTETLAIAIQLADILHHLHQHRVIHKDIKPGNILIHPDSKQVQLIDFSIASLLPKETQTIQSPNVLEGTLSYLAPEQTGRMNRGIDYRADYYALGVTLYQLLTRQLPFVSEDPLELIHCHIAKVPMSVNEVNPDVPAMLAAIAAKLMAKNAEDRYQSALGLKYDLEYCLLQYKETGAIAEFTLGQRDLSDRFIIPEKLYGRETEVQILLDAFERVATGTTELMLVAGFSGIGKTAVINEVHKPIVRQRGYFIKGKFDQFNRNIPFSAFVQAFRDLVGQLLSESDAQLQHWKTRILEALGENAQVIVELIPELERIIDAQSPAPELSGTAAQNRFNLLFQKFIQVFTQPQHPLVIFIDDLQWADSASLNLIQVLMAETKIGYLLLLGAYRDNEVFAAHPLMLTLEGMEKAGATINTITLQPLSHTSLNHLIADTLHAQEAVVQPLAELVMQKTQGNPFFATQFLKALHQDQLITFDYHTGHWQCDIVQVRDAALTDDVVQFMALQLQKLPTSTQEILKLAACIGAQFDLATLAIVSEQSQTEVATALWKALQEGLILPQSDIYKFYLGDTDANQHNANTTLHYKFLHDRVQQAAYSLIPPEQTQFIHYHIGSLLLENLSPLEQEQHIFELVGQLNYGHTLMIEPAKREELAQLNLAAGQKAIASTAYQAAIEYLEIGIALLGEQAWINQYHLMFNLYRNLASANLSNNSYESLDKIILVALENISVPIDRAEFYLFEIIKYTLQGEFEQAIQTGLHGLSNLEIEMIQDENLAELVRQELSDTANSFGDRSIISLLDLPNMNDARIQAAMKLLMALDAPAYISANFELYTLIALRAVRFSIEYGNLAESIKAYANYGLILSLTQGQYQRGYEFADLGMQLSYKLNCPSQRCKAAFLLGFWIQAWAKPLTGAATLNYEGFLAGMSAGENQFAAYNLFGEIYNRLFQGENLTTILENVETYELIAERTQDELLRIALAGARIFIIHLGVGQNAQEPDQAILKAEKVVQNGAASQAWLSVCLVYILKIHLCCLMGNFQQGYNQLLETEKRMSAIGGATTSSGYYYYGSLILLNLYLDLSPEAQRNALEQIQSNQLRLRNWSDSCSESFLHKYLLVAAEQHRVFGNKTDAIDLYDRAIAEAKANGYIQEAALANELAAKFYLNWGKEKVAAGYMQEAYYCYARWGAKAKVADLETRYPDLLRPILQRTEASTSILSTLATISPLTVSGHTSDRKSSSSASINQALDFAAILQASQALSSTIQFDELLHQLTQIILQNSGADHCALMLLSETGEWQVRAMSDDKPQSVYATANETQLCAEPLTNNPHVPVKLIQYVKNTQEVVVIDNMETTLPVIGDYLRQQQPKSVLCMPLLHQGHLIGILYLNNRLTCGVFTEDRILILNFLCTQAAISLENARLYQQLEYSLQDAQQKSQDLAEVLALSNGQQQILALIAQGVSLNIILAETARSIESHTHHPAYCSFLLTDTEGRLRHGAAPSLPAAYNALIDGIKIGPEVGSCGTAAYYKASVTVTDIVTDPLWNNYRVALDFGLRACTSTPILGAEGQVLATLAMYQPVAGEFTLHDRRLMEVATYVARIAIERHQADVELQNTQLRVLQSEKMASLGNLVAGVAHEINNPIGFLNGSINNAKDYVQDLLDYIALYQQHHPQAAAPVQDKAEQMDLEFLTEDLPKLLDSMQGATDRIKDISTSLRTFSRADTEHKVSANLHDGLSSTLLILKYRLKANEFRPAIAIIENYGNFPEINCFPGQLNQVFMNILANAIDMFDEMAQTLSFEAIKANPQEITIHTQQIGEQVKISIRDNGKGMSQEVQAKIFDHLFTTKEVGKGTGLGLAIARQIIVEKHGGKLEVQSQLGQGSEFCIYLPICG